MYSRDLRFHHPAAFWLGCAMVVAGVLAHLPMLAMAAPMHYRLAGMPMDSTMLLGMALVPLGVLLAAYGLMPRLQQMRRTSHAGRSTLAFHIADNVPLNREHWKLVGVLALALAVDVMKPATIGFVMPGLADEYGLGSSVTALLALSALSGTAVGSVIWGRLGDLFGRRASILLSALMFMGTSICGAMPAFGWNLLMCFMMGAAAGGMLPITFTLMAETIPSRHRGWLLVALGGVGTSAGYLLASGAAALVEPTFSWRALWLLNLPTGALIVLLNRYIPESPRFLALAGLHDQARTVLQQFCGESATITSATRASDGTEEAQRVSMRQLLRGRHAAISWGLMVAAVAWGLVNFGFLLWLPENLVKLGIDARECAALLARSALLALPGIVLVVALYQRWSSIRTLVLFIGLTALSLLCFIVIDATQLRSSALTIAGTVALLLSVSGVIATLIPYAAEIYPVHLRSTGAGLIAGGSKFGGILGALLGVSGLFEHFMLSALLIAVPLLLAGWMLARSGIETRGQGLEAIQRALAE
ncbi:MFS transporter [Rhodanobacter sp. AS-Z3]|uniref:MFS transporter n=1 Tax=Rhodanobacter sp. AS-Z3 TaxID=3031330 RepID=UPI002478A457|nr:MFS transporter [Rhodanobacter sp. AS-Z3]WEN15962.1 MFS transporter [Rhodanobacter sp. AS-Z3]